MSQCFTDAVRTLFATSTSSLYAEVLSTIVSRLVSSSLVFPSVLVSLNAEPSPLRLLQLINTIIDPAPVTITTSVSSKSQPATFPPPPSDEREPDNARAEPVLPPPHSPILSLLSTLCFQSHAIYT